MFAWYKLGKIFNPTDTRDRSWMHEYAQAPSTLVFDDFVRVYFSCRPKPDARGQYVSYTAFVDLFRQDLFRILRVSSEPVLQLGGLGTFDEFGTYPASVARSGNDILIYYAGHSRCESVPFNTAIGLAISKDSGRTFTRFGNGPVLSYSLNEPFVLSGPKIRRFDDRWYLFYIAGKKWIVAEGKPEVVYKIRCAISKDGIDWQKLNTHIIPDRLGDYEVQASPDVYFSNGRYHMFFCYMLTPDFRKNSSKSYRIGYAYSDDLIRWIREDSRSGIDVSKEGWDSEMIAYPHVFDLDGAVYMLYLGNEVGRYGFGLARLEGSLA